MQHASDNWWVSGTVLLLSLIIIFKVVSAQGGNWPMRSLLSVLLLFIGGSMIHQGISLLRMPSLPVSAPKLGIIAEYFLLTSLPALFIYLFLSHQHPKVPYIRRIAGLNAIDEAVGRATEMGRPVMMVPGISGLDVVTLQALSIFGYIARAVARFGNKSIIPTIDPIVTGVAEETLQDAYADEGRPELYDSGDVRYLTGQQFAFASGVAGILIREKVAASFLFGAFFAESLIFAEVGQQVGAIQVAGTTETNQIPFFIAACDYVIIGDEFYAASAYLSRDPTLLGSIVGQDYCKLLLLVVILLGIISISLLQVIHGGPAAHVLHWVVDFLKVK